MAKRNGWITIKGIIIAAIIVVLALGVWGGVKIAQDRGEQVRRADAVKEAEDRLDEIASQEAETEDSEQAEEQPAEDEDSRVAATIDEMPETGPGETMAVVGLAALAFAAASYATSKRQVRKLSENLS